jgi:SnoaL-like domain
MDDSKRAQIAQACERLLLEVAHLTDHGPHESIADLFTDDGELDRDGTVIRGRQALRDSYVKRPVTLMTRHLVSNVMVTLVSENEANCRACATVYRFRSQDGVRPVPPVDCEGPESVVEFEDHLIRTADGWKVRRRVLRTVINIRKA